MEESQSLPGKGQTLDLVLYIGRSPFNLGAEDICVSDRNSLWFYHFCQFLTAHQFTAGILTVCLVASFQRFLWLLFNF